MVNFIRLKYVIILLLCITSPLAFAKQLTFNRPADTPQARYVIDLLTQAYASLGYTLNVIDFEHQHALEAANNGLLDGQLGRIANIANNYSNLIKIDFPLFEFDLILLKNKSMRDVNKLSSIAVQSGYPAPQNYFNQHPYNGRIIKVKSVTAQLNLLVQQKVDAIILLDFLLFSKHPHFKQAGYKKEVLQTLQSFHFLHKRHIKLQPKLKAQLIKLHENGTIALLKAKHNLTFF